MLPEKFGKIFSQNFSQIVSNSMKDNGKALVYNKQICFYIYDQNNVENMSKIYLHNIR